MNAPDRKCIERVKGGVNSKKVERIMGIMVGCEDLKPITLMWVSPVTFCSLEREMRAHQ